MEFPKKPHLYGGLSALKRGFFFVNQRVFNPHAYVNTETYYVLSEPQWK